MARSDEKFPVGKKRPADGDPDGAQPLTKRFGRLQLNNEQGPVSDAKGGHNNKSPCPSSGTHDDAMQLDDTRYTTYIHNLDQELADPDTSEDELVLLPLAARMISVPESILSAPAQSKELVLYKDPTSLTVPREQDCVRRAILDSRARARARANGSSYHRNDTKRQSSNSAGTNSPDLDHEDPMDIDYDP